MSEHPLHQLAMQIRYDLTAAQGKLSELMRQVGEMEPLGAPRESFMNGPVLAECCTDCGCGFPWHTFDCTNALSVRAAALGIDPGAAVAQRREELVCESRSAAEGSLPSESVGGESVG